MKNSVSVKDCLEEAVGSLDRALKYAIEQESKKEVFNMILSAALYNEVGLEKTVKNILKQMLSMADVSGSVKKEISEFLKNF
ncbi:MAG: hypothetical protein ACTSQO_09225 [Candidatus Helarchaeota archaeon]